MDDFFSELFGGAAVEIEEVEEVNKITRVDVDKAYRTFSHYRSGINTSQKRNKKSKAYKNEITKAQKLLNKYEELKKAYDNQ